MKNWHKIMIAAASGLIVAAGSWFIVDLLTTRKDALDALRERRLQSSSLATDLRIVSRQIADLVAEMAALRRQLQEARDEASRPLENLEARTRELEEFARRGERFTAEDARAMERRLVKLILKQREEE